MTARDGARCRACPCMSRYGDDDDDDNDDDGHDDPDDHVDETVDDDHPLVHYYTTTLLHLLPYYTSALHFYTTRVLHNYTSTPLYDSQNTLPRYYTTAITLLHYCTTTLRPHNATTLLHVLYYTTTLLHCDTTALTLKSLHHYTIPCYTIAPEMNGNDAKGSGKIQQELDGLHLSPLPSISLSSVLSPLLTSPSSFSKALRTTRTTTTMMMVYFCTARMPPCGAHVPIYRRRS